MRDRYAAFHEVGEASASVLQGKLHAGPELRQKLTGPANLEIEFHLDDIATASIAFGHRADVVEPFEFLVPLVFEQRL